VTDADTVVVGGGLAGLVAARNLRRAGLRVLLLEARDRLGGRVFARELAGTGLRVDFGGTWVIPAEHPALFAELDRYGIGTVVTPEPTWYASELNGTVRASGDIDRAVLDDLARVFDAIRSTGRESESLGELARRHAVSPQGYAWLQAHFRYLNGAGLDDVSALALADYPMSDLARPDHYTHEITGTTESLVTALAHDMDAELRLGTAVRRVTDTGSSVALDLDDGARVTAGRAVMTVPVNTLGAITFEAAIDAVEALATTGHAGHSTKLWIVARDVPGTPRLLSDIGPFPYVRLVRRLEDGTALLVGFSDRDGAASMAPTEGAIATGHEIAEQVIADLG
jgi:(S)-6-hydroxynicotine oxidase